MRSSLRQPRDALDDDRGIALGERQIIGGAERPGAQIGKAEPGDVARRARHGERPSLDHQARALARGTVGQLGKGRFQRAVRRLVQRRVVERLADQPGQAVVAAAVELEHVELLLQQLDERQKPVAVKPMLVQFIGRAVRGRDHHHPRIEQGGEQPIEDHRVGDIVDLEFVEADKRRLGRDIGRHLGDRFARLVPPLLLDAVVHFEHEGVEMHSPLARAGRGGKEQIHQHRFAAPDRAAQIEPDRRVRAMVLAKAEAGEPAAQPVFRAVVEERAIKALQPLDRQLLRRIGFEPAVSAPSAIERHRRLLRWRAAGVRRRTQVERPH